MTSSHLGPERFTIPLSLAIPSLSALCPGPSRMITIACLPLYVATMSLITGSIAHPRGYPPPVAEYDPEAASFSPMGHQGPPQDGNPSGSRPILGRWAHDGSVSPCVQKLGDIYTAKSQQQQHHHHHDHHDVSSSDRSSTALSPSSSPGHA